MIGILQKAQPDAGSRFYATPNDHLVLTYYSGVPVQSIAPIRKDFFDTYPGKIMLFEKDGIPGQPQPWHGNPIFRGFELKESTDWWEVFFYRFVDPISRGGRRLVYGDRPEGRRYRPVPGWTVHVYPPLTRGTHAPSG